MNIPDDIKAVVRAAVNWKETGAIFTVESTFEKGAKINRAVRMLSPESLKLIEEATNE